MAVNVTYGFADLSGLAALQRFHLIKCCEFTNSDVAHLSVLTKLQHLDLSGC
jgi:hypothetical protein